MSSMSWQLPPVRPRATVACERRVGDPWFKLCIYNVTVADNNKYSY